MTKHSLFAFMCLLISNLSLGASCRVTTSKNSSQVAFAEQLHQESVYLGVAIHDLPNKIENLQSRLSKGGIPVLEALLPLATSMVDRSITFSVPEYQQLVSRSETLKSLLGEDNFMYTVSKAGGEEKVVLFARKDIRSWAFDQELKKGLEEAREADYALRMQYTKALVALNDHAYLLESLIKTKGDLQAVRKSLKYSVPRSGLINNALIAGTIVSSAVWGYLGLKYYGDASGMPKLMGTALPFIAPWLVGLSAHEWMKSAYQETRHADRGFESKIISLESALERLGTAVECSNQACVVEALK